MENHIESQNLLIKKKKIDEVPHLAHEKRTKTPTTFSCHGMA
jgi:hypothetical protein